MSAQAAAAIERFRASLDPGTLATVDALRALIAAADDRLEEDFKWNAPSFTLGPEHRVTLGLERKGGVRMVLHRGVAVRDATGFAFDDPDRLARWPAPDRGVVVVRDAAEVEGRHDRLGDLVRRWLRVPT